MVENEHLDGLDEEATATTEAGLQAERDEADAGAGETMPEDAPVEMDFSELSEAEARSVLFNAIVETNERLAKAEMNLMLLGQSFVRILQKAGELPEEGSQIEVVKSPKMATSIKQR